MPLKYLLIAHGTYQIEGRLENSIYESIEIFALQNANVIQFPAPRMGPGPY